MSTETETETKRKPKKPDDPNRPPWLPPLDEGHSLPTRLRLRLETILVPMYTNLVAKVDDPLEQTVGMSIVQMAWMELLNCYEAGKCSLGDLEFPDIPPAMAANRESWFRLQERLARRKLQAIELLKKLRRHKQRGGAEQNGAEQTGAGMDQSTLVAGIEGIVSILSESQHGAEQNGPGRPETADPVDQNADWPTETPDVLTKNHPADRRRAKQEQQRQKALRRRAKKHRR